MCAYINRRGQVIRVGVGTPRQTQIPPMELPRYGAERLSGIRCIATHLKPEPPNEAALTAMALQRLDALVVLNITGTGFTRRGGGATGYVKEAYLAHLTPQDSRTLIPSPAAVKVEESQFGFARNKQIQSPSWNISPPLSLDDLADQDLVDLVENLEAEFQREFIAQEVDSDHDRVLIVGLMTSEMTPLQFQDTLVELARLVDTAGGDVLQTIQQKRSRVHPQTVVGEGKVQEIALTAQTLGVNLVVFDRDLSPSQVRNLEMQIGIRVVDRTLRNANWYPGG